MAEGLVNAWNYDIVLFSSSFRPQKRAEIRQMLCNFLNLNYFKSVFDVVHYILWTNLYFIPLFINILCRWVEENMIFSGARGAHDSILPPLCI